jgi:ATP-dependent Lon protease
MSRKRQDENKYTQGYCKKLRSSTYVDDIKHNSNNESFIKKSDNESDNNSDSDSESESESESESVNEQDVNENVEDLNEEDIKKLINNTKAYKTFNEVKDFISNTEPCILKILETPMLLKDKAELFQQFEIYKSLQECTEEWLGTRKNINTLFAENQLKYKQYNKHTKQKHLFVKQQEEKYKRCNSSIDMKYKILSLNTSDSNIDIIYNKYQELNEMESKDDEFAKLKNWINLAISLPYNNIKTFKYNNDSSKFISDISTKFNEELFGMQNVKEQLMLFLNAKLSNPNMTKCNLGLVGPSGVGKTAICRLLSKVMDMPFQQISFGGVEKADFVKGHDYCYVGSQPGCIINALKKLKCKNGIIFFDEFEKIADNNAITSALLHIIDPTQNSQFKDNYLSELDIDLSNIWFIFSMNQLPNDTALKDRIFEINVDGYNTKDKIQIINKYLIPRALQNIGMSIGDVYMNVKNAEYLINKVTTPYDKGVRCIEKAVHDIISKIHFLKKHDIHKNNNTLNISFSIDYNINFPLEINRYILDKLIPQQKQSKIDFMYM